MRRSLQLDLLIAAGLFLLPLLFFWQVTLGNRTLLPADNLYQFQPWAAYREQQGVPAVPHNSLLSDLVLENLPWKKFIRDSLANGEIPLWNPYIFAGVPFLAAGQHSAMYPFSIIYYVMPLDKAYGWFTVSQLWLAGVFMYLFARGLGVGRFGALIAGIAYQMSGFFVASVVFQMIIAAAAWLPFLLLMCEFTIRQRPLFGRPTVIPWVALGAIGLGMEILAGHVEFTYYALLVMGFWSACRLGIMMWKALTLNPSPARRGTSNTAPSSPHSGGEGPEVKVSWRTQILKPAVSLILLVVLGLGVGAIQFIPLLELAGQNFRQGSASFEEVRGYAYPPRHALAFLMPNFYGNPAQHTYFDVFAGQTTPINWKRADGSTVTDTFWQVGKNYVEGACYVGLLTLALALIGLLNAAFEKSPRARIETVGPYRAIMAVLSVISVLFIFGTPAYAILFYGLPGFSQLHSPFRWVFPLTLCVAALAGFGAEAVQRCLPHPPPPSPLRREGESSALTDSSSLQALNTSLTSRVTRIVALVLIVVGALTLIGLALSRVFFERLSGPITALWRGLAGADIFPNAETFYSVAFQSILIFGIFVLASGFTLILSRRPIWKALAVGVLALDLVVASAGFNPAADPKWLEFEPPAITWLKQQNPQEWRFTAVEGPTHTMNANVGWLYGLQDVRGYDSIIPKQYADYMRGMGSPEQLIYNRIASLRHDQLYDLISGLLEGGTGGSPLRFLSIRYLISEKEIYTEKHPGYVLVYHDDAVRIYENQGTLPRAYWFNVGDEAYAGSKWVYNSSVHMAQIVEAYSNQVTINVSIPNLDRYRYFEFGPPIILVLSDSYFPGWRAYIRPQGATNDQEKELNIELWDRNFRAVRFEPGSWTIRFRYSPPSFQVGAFTTFISLVILLFAVLVWLWRRFYTENASAGESGGVRRLAKNSIAPIALNLFNRGIDFAFALIMLRILGPADAGVYYYAVVIFGWFDTLTNFGLNLLLTREVARDRSSARRYLLNSSVLRLGLAGIGVPLLFAFMWINQVLKPDVPVPVAVILLLYVGLVPSSISYGLTALFYAFEKAEIPAAISTLSVILKTIFGLAVLVAGWGVIGLAGASIAINVITLVVLWGMARGLTSPPDPLSATSHWDGSNHSEGEAANLEPALMRQMIYAGWPLMLNNLLASLFFKIDVTLLQPLKGSNVVGQYSTAYKWVDAIGVIPSLFTMALLPIMSRQAKEDPLGLQRSYQFAVKLLVMLALPVAVVTTALARFLIGVLGGSQYLPDGALALQLMIWFIPIGWINSLTNYVLIALDQQRPMRWAFALGVSFNVIANLLFIPLYSFRAAAVITIFSEVVLLIAFYWLLRKALAPVPWIAMLWKPALAALVMIGALVALWPVSQALALSIGIASYPAVLVVLRPFSAWELSQIAALLPGRVRRLVRVNG